MGNMPTSDIPVMLKLNRRLYRVCNKGGKGTWVLARNENEAINYCLRVRFLKSPGGVTFFEDQTSQYIDQKSAPGLRELLHEDTDPTTGSIKIGTHPSQWCEHSR